MRGTMIWFNEEKGHGFIRTEEDERLYVAASSFLDAPPVGRCGGLTVEFEVVEQNGTREATNCVVTDEADPPRARLRRGARVR